MPIRAAAMIALAAVMLPVSAGAAASRPSGRSWGAARDRDLIDQLKLAPPPPLPRPDNLATRALLLDGRDVEVNLGYRTRRFGRIDVRRDPTFGAVLDETRRVDDEIVTDLRARLRQDVELGIVVPYASRREGRPTLVPFSAVTADDTIERRARADGLGDLELRLSWQRIFRAIPLRNVALDLSYKPASADGDRARFSDLSPGTGQRDVGLSVRAKEELRGITLAGGVGVRLRETARVRGFTGAATGIAAGDELTFGLDLLRPGPENWWVAALSLSGLATRAARAHGTLPPPAPRRLLAITPAVNVHIFENVEVIASYRIPLHARNLTADGQGYDLGLRARF